MPDSDFPLTFSSDSETRQPLKRVVNLGPSNELIELEVICEWLDLSRKEAAATMRNLRVPCMRVGKKRCYYNHMAIDKAFYYINRLGSPVPKFATSGSPAGPNWRFRLNDDDLKAMNDPLFVAEWLATGPQGRVSGIHNKMLNLLQAASKKAAEK